MHFFIRQIDSTMEEEKPWILMDPRLFCYLVFSAATYRCFELRGLSGMVMHRFPLSTSGSTYSFTTYGLDFRSRKVQISSLVRGVSQN